MASECALEWDGGDPVRDDCDYARSDDLAEQEIRSALKAAFPLVTGLGGFGRRFIAIRVHRGRALTTFETENPVDAEIRRGPTGDGMDELVPGIARELARARERPAYEEAENR